MKTTTVIILIATVFAADFSAYLALAPDSFAKKSWILVLASMAVVLSSGLIGKYVAKKSKNKSKRRFFEQFHSDLFVQRYAEYLEVDYENSSVNIRELPESAVESGEELLAKRN
ncbi:hypothetical protein D3C77_643250 [compost metagenome]